MIAGLEDNMDVGAPACCPATTWSGWVAGSLPRVWRRLTHDLPG